MTAHMHTPFLISQTDGQEAHFWEIECRGNIHFLLNRQPVPFDFPWTTAQTPRKYYILFVYCTESELFELERWINQIIRQKGGVKILGTTRMSIERLKLFVNDHWFVFPFKKVIIDYYLKQQ